MKEAMPQAPGAENPWEGLKTNDQVKEKGEQMLKTFADGFMNYSNLDSIEAGIVETEKFFARNGLPDASVSINDPVPGMLVWEVRAPSPLKGGSPVHLKYEQRG